MTQPVAHADSTFRRDRISSPDRGESDRSSSACSPSNPGDHDEPCAKTLSCARRVGPATVRARESRNAGQGLGRCRDTAPRYRRVRRRGPRLSVRRRPAPGRSRGDRNRRRRQHPGDRPDPAGGHGQQAQPADRFAARHPCRAAHGCRRDDRLCPPREPRRRRLGEHRRRVDEGSSRPRSAARERSSSATSTPARCPSPSAALARSVPMAKHARCR